jgi:uncharacterized protein (TIGR02328 family)
MAEMTRRGYSVTDDWWIPPYRGKKIGHDHSPFTKIPNNQCIYPDHDEKYLNECTENLRDKGVNICRKTIVG